MVKSKQTVFAIVILASVIAAYFIFSESEAEKVKKQFKFITEKINKESDESPLITAANANKIKEVFTDPFTLQAPDYETFRDVSTDEISPFVLTMQSQHLETSLKFYDYDIEFPSKDAAHVSVIERLRAKLKTGEYVEDINVLSCRLIKVDDTWLITEIEVVEALLE